MYFSLLVTLYLFIYKNLQVWKEILTLVLVSFSLIIIFLLIKCDFIAFGFVLDDDADSDALPEWLTEAADDLDVSIAQRHFEEAYAIIQKTEEYFASAQDDQSLADIK